MSQAPADGRGVRVSGAVGMRPYVIWTPPWDHKVGGIRALYRLAEELADRGQTVTISNGQHVDPDAITVYPEIVQDNPLGATCIVRWLLNKAHVPDDGLAFDWQDTGSGRPLLTLDILDHDLLARREGPRSGVALVVRKGIADPALIPSGAIEITRTWPANRADTVTLLANSEYLVSFDEFTLLNLEAMLLGTPVLLYPSGRWSRAEIEAQGWTRHGIAWSLDELDEAREATEGAWDWYRDEAAQYAQRVDAFVEETQARWPTCG